MFKNKTRLGSNFHFKDRIPKILLLMSFLGFSVESPMSTIMMNLLDTWM